MIEQPCMAIVVIAYNRPHCLTRLLSSLLAVEYEGHSVPLIISVDYSGADDVITIAKEFQWPFGEKIIKAHSERLGLKKHVLSCGALVEAYDAIIVLEDDLIVSRAMYAYAWRAVDFYRDDDSVAAISLYAKKFGETAMLPFEPVYNGSDTYFIRTAESWGQIWMKKQWNDFVQWYRSHDAAFDYAQDVPPNVCAWGKNSWKKYHVRYCIENHKWTVYPYDALSTCMGDAGEHFEAATPVWQVPVIDGSKNTFRFAESDDPEAVKYDAFLERCELDKDICMDLYGKKQAYEGRQYVISSGNLPYAICASYGLSVRPHEMNIIRKVDGRTFFKYDLTRPDDRMRADLQDKTLYYNYMDLESALRKASMGLILRELKRRIKKKFIR